MLHCSQINLGLCRVLYNSSNLFLLQLDPLELNNTRKAKREILFFNRVPKVGSQTTMELLKQLSVRNHFHYHKDKTQKVEQIKLPYSKEVSTVQVEVFGTRQLASLLLRNADENICFQWFLLKTSNFQSIIKLDATSTMPVPNTSITTMFLRVTNELFRNGLPTLLGFSSPPRRM